MSHQIKIGLEVNNEAFLLQLYVGNIYCAAVLMVSTNFIFVIFWTPTYLPICARPPRLFVISPTALIHCQIDFIRKHFNLYKANATDRPLYFQPLERFKGPKEYFYQYCKTTVSVLGHLNVKTLTFEVKKNWQNT